MKHGIRFSLDTLFFVLLVFIPLTLGAVLFHVSATVTFFLAAVAVIPLAKFIGEATEELSLHTGPGVGGFLNATFGNAPELLIGIFAVQAGLTEVVKASITGSIIGNLLLVLGSAMFAGGIRYKKQKFNRTAALAGNSSLFLAVIALTIPAIFLRSVNGASDSIQTLSNVVSLLLIFVYIAHIWFSLYTHRHLYNGGSAPDVESRWSVKQSIVVLILATVAVAWISDVLVASIEPVVSAFGWTTLFIGVIFVAIIGNIAEHTSAITMALKNKMEVALQISVGSATQIVMFVAPLLVLISLLFPTHLSFVFNEFELVAIILSVFIANLVVQDGESNWLEGIQLIIAWVIMAIAFFLHP